MRIRFVERKNKTVDLLVYGDSAFDKAGMALPAVVILETHSGFKDKHAALAAFEELRYACAMGKIVVEGETIETEK